MQSHDGNRRGPSRGDFEYEYSMQGDGTVPIELARLPGARHSYVECGHSDLPLSDRVIAGTNGPAFHGRHAALCRRAAAQAWRIDARTRHRVRQQFQARSTGRR
jgi:hypothetical protein